MDSIVIQAKNIISNNRYLSLATCNENKPWVAGLAYAVSEDYCFYFYSAKNSIHATHIYANPEVAFTIYDSTASSDDVDGLQIAGTASEVTLKELPHTLEIYYKQSFPDKAIREKWQQPIEAFREIAIKRFYKIVPTAIYKLDLTIIEVDKRVTIDLQELKKLGPSK